MSVESESVTSNKYDVGLPVCALCHQRYFIICQLVSLYHHQAGLITNQSFITAAPVAATTITIAALSSCFQQYSVSPSSSISLIT